MENGCVRLSDRGLTVFCGAYNLVIHVESTPDITNTVVQEN